MDHRGDVLRCLQRLDECITSKSNSSTWLPQPATDYPIPEMITKAVMFVCACIFAQNLCADEKGYSDIVRPFLDKHCVSCHGGNRPKEELNLEGPKVSEVAIAPLRQMRMLELIGERLRSRTMPPEKKPQPDSAELKPVLAWIDARLDAAGGMGNPGHIMIRRLTKLDYRNTIRDMFKLEVEGIDAFPSDDVGFGFDNIASIISLPPLLMERYYKAAESIAVRAVTGRPRGRARKFIEGVQKRLFRRTVTKTEVARYLNLYESLKRSGANELEALQHAVAAMLVSPHFLYRIERDGVVGEDRVINDFELAARLSYFLWSSIPDKELFDLARKQKLRKGENLSKQIRRMLADPKIKTGLVENFAGQWLQLRRLDAARPNPSLFPTFDDGLRTAMRIETEKFFMALITEDRSIFDLLNADFTFVNEQLATHYGIEGIKGEAFQRVNLGDTRRRGVMTHGSILTMTSHSARTSPVIRGKWILETIFGTPPPSPPPNVPDLEEVKVSGTLRQRIEMHRKNKGCASCHNRMDPLGLAFENFDAIGAFRTKDESIDVDASGKLPSGDAFKDALELITLIRTKQSTTFRKNLLTQMMTYALGRRLGLSDRRVVNKLLGKLEDDEDRFVALITHIVESDPFQKRRNPRSISVDLIPDAVKFELRSLGDQMAQIDIKSAEENGNEISKTGPMDFEITTVLPLSRVVVEQDETIGIKPLGKPHPESAAHRYRLSSGLGRSLYLIFEEGVIAPFEYSDDFLTPVPPSPESDKKVIFQINRYDLKWNAALKGPRNPRPGTVYSFTFDAELVGKKQSTLDVVLAAHSTSNRHVSEDSGMIPIINGKHTYTRVGRRNTRMIEAFRSWMTVVAEARKEAIVSNLSPIRFIRPQLGLSDDTGIDFGKLDKAKASAPSANRRIFNAQTKTLRDFKTEWATVLHGVRQITIPDEKKQYFQESDYVGIEIVGEHADLFEIISPNATEDGKGLKLIGKDGKVGLVGGEESEFEEFQIRFRGSDKTGNYKAQMRVVTQAGGRGVISKGEEGEPMAGLYYLEIPVAAEVR
jgi:hypothetical protein